MNLSPGGTRIIAGMCSHLLYLTLQPSNATSFYFSCSGVTQFMDRYSRAWGRRSQGAHLGGGGEERNQLVTKIKHEQDLFKIYNAFLPGKVTQHTKLHQHRRSISHWIGYQLDHVRIEGVSTPARNGLGSIFWQFPIPAAAPSAPEPWTQIGGGWNLLWEVTEHLLCHNLGSKVIKFKHKPIQLF